MPSFSTALSGLSANGAAIDTVGNNLANMNTTGFKASTTAFRDIVNDALVGPTVANGQGIAKPITTRNFTQGSIQASQGSLDAAISGGGFFLLRNSEGQQLLTRAGNFHLSASGNLMTLSGEHVQGWTSSNGVLNTSGLAANIVLPAAGSRVPLATTDISINANLDAGAANGAGSVHTAPVEVVDSLGATHVLTVSYTKTGSNAWSYDISIPGEQVGGTAGTPKSVGTGALTFDANGRLITPAAPGNVAVSVTGFANGAAPMTMNLSLYGTDGLSRLTQFAQSSATVAVEQNGGAAAELVGLSISDGGNVVAEYANGRRGVIAQLAVATLRNPDSLTSIGNNNYRVTEQSSALAIGVSGVGGRGNIVGEALEGSTVDVSREFTNLIVYQRGYQANSKVITVLDELTQNVINLMR